MKIIANQKLIDIFNKKTYEDLKKLIKNNKDDLIILWNDSKYEVTYEIESNSSFFIFSM
jgi:predicted GTPase